MLKVYDNAYSSCSTKVRLVLSEKGIAWEREPIDLTVFDQKTPAYLALNPNGVVPTIIFGRGAPLTESHVIIQFLDNQYPGNRLTPDEPEERARMQMFLKQLDDFHPFQGILNYDQLFLPYWRRLEEDEFENRLKRFADEGEAQRLRRMVRHGLPKDRIERALAATDKFFCELDDRLCRSKFVMGERYTLSDIALTPYINSSLHIISDLWFGKRKGISRWLEQIRERPNFHAAVFGFPNAPDLDEAIAAAPAGGGFRTL